MEKKRLLLICFSLFLYWTMLSTMASGIGEADLHSPRARRRKRKAMSAQQKTANETQRKRNQRARDTEETKKLKRDHERTQRWKRRQLRSGERKQQENSQAQQRMRAHREDMSQEQLQQENSQAQQRMRAHREEMSQEQLQQENSQLQQRMRAHREEMSQEQLQQENSQAQQRMRTHREEMSQEQLQQQNSQAQQRMRAHREEMSQEQLQQQNSQAQQRMRAHRQGMSEREKIVERLRNSLNRKKIRSLLQTKMDVFGLEEKDFLPLMESIREEIKEQGQTSFFSNMESSVDKSVLLYYLNSDMFRFGEYREFDSNWEGKSPDFDMILQAIVDEALTPKERGNLVSGFTNKYSFTDGVLVTCGACGYRENQKSIDTYASVSLDDSVMDVLRYTDDQSVDHENNINEAGLVCIPLEEPSWDQYADERDYANPMEKFTNVRPFNVVSAVRYNDLWFHLHPEVVTNDGFTRICPSCMRALEKGNVPARSVAAGVDFGSYRRVGLTEPNTHELLILSVFRMYFATVKLSSNRSGKINFDVRSSFKGNLVMFLQNAIQWMTEAVNEEEFYSAQRMGQLLKIFMLDPKGLTDRRMEKMLQSSVLLARPWVLYQWFAILSKVHPQFKEMCIPTYQELVRNVEKANANIMADTTLVTDSAFLEREQHIGSDVAHARHDEIGVQTAKRGPKKHVPRFKPQGQNNDPMAEDMFHDAMDWEHDNGTSYETLDEIAGSVKSKTRFVCVHREIIDNGESVETFLDACDCINADDLLEFEDTQGAEGITIMDTNSSMYDSDNDIIDCNPGEGPGSAKSKTKSVCVHHEILDNGETVETFLDARDCINADDFREFEEAQGDEKKNIVDTNSSSYDSDDDSIHRNPGDDPIGSLSYSVVMTSPEAAVSVRDMPEEYFLKKAAEFVVAGHKKGGLEAEITPPIDIDTFGTCYDDCRGSDAGDEEDDEEEFGYANEHNSKPNYVDIEESNDDGHDEDDENALSWWRNLIKQDAKEQKAHEKWKKRNDSKMLDDKTTWGIKRSPEIANEFDLGETLPAGAFPTVFMLGKVYGKHFGAMKLVQRKHLLNQHTLIPARNRMMCAYLLNATQKCDVMRGVNLHVNKNPRSIDFIERTMENPEKMAEISKGITNNVKPTKETMKIAREFAGHLYFSGRSVSYGAVAGQNLTSMLLETVKRHGHPSCWLTLGLEDRNDPRSLRASMHTIDNEQFPAQFQEGCKFGENGLDFVSKLREVSTMVAEGVEVQDSFLKAYMTEDHRTRRAMEDPVTYVRENMALLESVMTHIFGVEPDGYNGWWDEKKTKFFMNGKGAYGHITAVIGVPEDHMKGTLHYHFLLWGGLSPYVMQRFSEVMVLRKAISSTLDSTYNAEIPVDQHLAEIGREAVSGRRSRRAGIKRGEDKRPIGTLLVRPIPSVAIDENGEISSESLLAAVQEQIRSQNWHHHLLTCEKGAMGKSGCRMCMPCEEIYATIPVVVRRLHHEKGHQNNRTLQDAIDDGNCTFEYQYGMYEVVDMDNSDDVSLYGNGDFDILNPFKSKEAVVWELKRGKIPLDEHVLPTPVTSNVDPETGAEYSKESGVMFLHNREEIVLWLETNVLVHCLKPDAVKRWKRQATNDEICYLIEHITERLSKASGYISAHSCMLSLCTGSHNNSQLLGSSHQAKAAMSYISPYMEKRKTPLLHSLLILDEVIRLAKKYPTTSTDEPGSPRRNAIFVLEKFLNRVNMEMELSDYQVAAALLGLPSIIRTNPYTYLNVQGAENYRKWLAIEKLNEDASDAIFARQNDAIDQAERNGEHDFGLDDFFISNNDDREGNAPDERVDVTASADHLNESSDEMVVEQPQALRTELTNEEEGERAVPLLPMQPSNLYVGPVKIYNIPQDPTNVQSESIKIPVKLASYFNNRGEQLRQLSRLEYAATVQIQKVKDPLKSTTRKQNFPFTENHILHSTHAQQLRAKQCTVIVCTGAPPHPGTMPANNDSDDASAVAALAEWKNKADAFAKYVLLLCRPEPNCYSDVHKNEYRYDWESLTSWINELANDNSMISKFRLVSLFRRFCELRCSMAESTMLSHYRRRARDIWTKNKANRIAREEEEFESSAAKRTKLTLDNPLAQMLFENDHPRLSKQLHTQTINALNCESGETQAFSKCTYSLPSQMINNDEDPVSSVNAKESSSFRYVSIYKKCNEDEDTFTEYLHCQEEICTGFVKATDDDDEDDNSTYTDVDVNKGDNRDESEKNLSNKDKVMSLLQKLSKTLNKEQYELVKTYGLSFLRDSEHTAPEIAFCLGMGGTGKTHAVKAMDSLAEIVGGTIVKTSFNHINVIPFDNADTTSSMFKLKAEKDAKEVRGLDMNHFEKSMLNNKRVMLLVVDECGNQSTWSIAKMVHVIQQQMRHEGLPCINILFIGDPNQLGPVLAGLPVWRMMMEMLRKRYAAKVKSMTDEGCEPQKKKYKRSTDERRSLDEAIDTVDNPRRMGTEHFMRAAFIELNEQQRSTDEKHNTFTRHMFRGERITGQDICERYCMLSQSDFVKHDETGSYHNETRTKWIEQKLTEHNLCLHNDNNKSPPYTTTDQLLTMAELLNRTRGFKQEDYDDLFKGIAERLEPYPPPNTKNGEEEGSATGPPACQRSKPKVVSLETLMYCRYHTCQPWFEAPIICGTHRSRMSLTHEAAINYASTVGEVVVRWPVQRLEWEQAPEEGMREGCIQNDPCFHQYFVGGGRGNFSATLCKGFQLVNAVGFVFHSICMETPEEQEDYERKVRRAAPGTVITLAKPPLYVNIAIHPDDVCPKKLKKLKNMFRNTNANYSHGQDVVELQSDSGYLVVPVPQGEYNREYKTIPVRGSSNNAYDVSRVKLRSFFPLSLSLTMTVNRSQGQTMKKLILALSKNPIYVLTYAHIYVALTRVREGKDIRLLVSGKNRVTMTQSLEYISHLRPDTAMMAMLYGFRRGAQSLERWTEGRFDEVAAIEYLVRLEGQK